MHHRTICFFSASSDAFIYISHVVSYFYERFKYVKFRLFNKHHYWTHEHRGPCYVGQDRLPLIKQVHHAIGNKYPTTPSECFEEALSRVHRITDSHYSVTFPKGKMRNVVPHFRAPLTVCNKLPRSAEFRMVFIGRHRLRTSPHSGRRVTVSTKNLVDTPTIRQCTRISQKRFCTRLTSNKNSLFVRPRRQTLLRRRHVCNKRLELLVYVRKSQNISRPYVHGDYRTQIGIAIYNKDNTAHPILAI